MKRRICAPMVSLVLIFLLTFLSPMVHAGDSASFRPSRVRAFAPESATSLLVREGRATYRRLTLAKSCPALSHSDRVAFQTGSSLTAIDEQGRQVPVVRGQAPTVVSTGTRSAFVVAITANSRVACRLASVAPADQAAFEAAAQLHGSRDNRYAGDGRSG